MEKPPETCSHVSIYQLNKLLYPGLSMEIFTKKGQENNLQGSPLVDWTVSVPSMFLSAQQRHQRRAFSDQDVVSQF